MTAPAGMPRHKSPAPRARVQRVRALRPVSHIDTVLSSDRGFSQGRGAAAAFRAVVANLRLTAARKAWLTAREWNSIAHDATQPTHTRERAFELKNHWAGRAVQLVPELVELGDTELLYRGIVGLHLRGTSALHLRVSELDVGARTVVVSLVMGALRVPAA